MKNQQGDSLTPMVGQNAARFPDRDTVNTPFTPRQAKATAHFLDMAQAAQARDGGREVVTGPELGQPGDRQDLQRRRRVVAELPGRLSQRARPPGR